MPYHTMHSTSLLRLPWKGPTQAIGFCREFKSGSQNGGRNSLKLNESVYLHHDLSASTPSLCNLCGEQTLGVT